MDNSALPDIYAQCPRASAYISGELLCMVILVRSIETSYL